MDSLVRFMVLSNVKTIFLDDGGVMNNNDLRAPQWRELVAKYFAPKYGGTIDKWKSANEVVFEQVFEQYEQIIRGSPETRFNDWWGEIQIQWLTDMFNFVKITPPPYDHRQQISREASIWITTRVRSAYSGVVDTIKKLHKQGFTLCTASGEVSWELKGYLTGMKVINCFDRLYGCDLVDTFKGSQKYYEKIFDDMNINDPSQVLVVDDSIDPIIWASELGANVVHVLNSNTCTNSKCLHIERLEELPTLLSS